MLLVFLFSPVRKGERMYKIHLVILVNPKNLLRDTKNLANFWKGYISQCAGQKVISVITEKISDDEFN